MKTVTSITVPDELIPTLQKVAEKRNMSLIELLRAFIKIGILADAADKNEENQGLYLLEKGETEGVIKKTKITF